jgi:hypothetical protein
MKNRSIIAGLVLTGFILGSAAITWACESAGPNKHIGMATAVDGKAKTFTIRDAETDHLMTFVATDKMLKEIKVDSRIRVSFKEENGILIAVEIQS